MKHIFLITLILIGISSCEKVNERRQEKEAEELANMYSEIISMAESVNCVDSTKWSFTPVGSKACGGPSSYLAYPITIDTLHFLNKVEAHKKAEDVFNRKWGVMSDCGVPYPPSGITCKEGKPVFTYTYF